MSTPPVDKTLSKAVTDAYGDTSCPAIRDAQELSEPGRSVTVELAAGRRAIGEEPVHG
ncbi:MAG TPA: hypothetical protein VEQ66_14450 [Propionibacteriaceae bacterium]|nr:hypothetical protein [Propionibacteriaceae bacterium]